MEIARFGTETFHANSTSGIYTPSDLSFEYGKAIETQSTAGKKPTSYIGDINLLKSGFKLHLDSRFVNVKTKIENWKKYAEENDSYLFTIGGKLVSQSRFVVTSVKVSNIKINGRGVMLSADLDISIQEYANRALSKSGKWYYVRKLSTKPLEEYE